MNSIQLFNTEPFIAALKAFFKELKVPVDYLADEPASPADVLGERFKATNEAHKLIDDVYALGIVNDAIFEGTETFKNLAQVKNLKADYDGLLIFGVTLKPRQHELLPTRSQLAEIARVFNREFHYTPVVVIFKYGEHLAFANTERLQYKQEWREGEQVGKVTMLKDVNITKPHAAHLKILSGLTIDTNKIDSFQILYNYWQSVFSLQALNNQFYADLQDWFYYAAQNIKLQFKPDYLDEKENIKNFLIRLLSRTLFCWFVKEKGLIKSELLELTDWQGSKFNLTHDVDDKKFLKSNSYYRGILQNIFFNALNQKEKKSSKDFGWTKYWHPDFKKEWLTDIPYLNGGIFDIVDGDNDKESIEDTVIKVPNFLFYGIEEKKEVTRGRGARATASIEKVEHKGLNGILKSYKFTLDENTPFEEDIALDPEMLGLVFENLLAELDPNLEESTIKSIRKQTGSYYTPRKVILEMVNDSLYLYLSKFIIDKYTSIKDVKTKVNDLVYYNKLNSADSDFEKAVVHALDQFKVLDPACGSGAFPMGMLHRMVDILKLVDAHNEKWVELKLKNVDQAQRADFKKVLTSHLDDYGRKLGIIRDSIYGIDIQPLAVQITKLRFFISLLIDQKTAKGITPMPNIETKIICADSLRNIQTDMHSNAAITKLVEARNRYYQPDITPKERQTIADEIVEVLDVAFPSFSYQVTGKRIPGQNKELIRKWFTHGTLAAPFFNMDFFYPELKEAGGFDCIIGNPPYGGTKITDEVRNALDIESKDPYGAFIARFLQRSTDGTPKITPLKHGGVLAFIASDTFMTIKSHLKLRRHLMQNYVHKMLRMHPDTFRATVNTVIMVAERNTQREPDEKHICLMADLTNISIHDNYEHFTEVLNLTKGVDFSNSRKGISNEEYAIYYYPQALIKTNSNLPFFVASPKLFALMNDSGKDLKKELKEIGGKRVQVRKIPMNGKEIEVVKLGDIADVKVGLQTGDNNAYLFQNPEARGNYRSIRDYEEFLLTDEDLEKIRNNDSLRLSVIDKGISKDDVKSERYFGGRYIIPYDKGGESDAEGGWMPNYFVPTNYFIDWSEWAIRRMKSLTTAERNKLEGKEGGNNKLCSRFQNSESYFTKAIDCSRVGIYSPTYRIATDTVYDSGCNDIYVMINSRENNLGILASRFWRFQFISFINHTVNSQTDDNDDVIFVLKSNEKLIINNVNFIIQNQKSNPRYDYASHEQIEIDKLVYEAYGLNAEDVQEVEHWYARRYPKLSAAQKANLRALGKSDNYLELYGLK
ncbi:MAG: type IIS restriction/modification enzyme [Bacteroidetes bacterium OLB11]|nr:MAG: type IIS restriction/modification enzyme [Bacteroidetes bacterium OLB11]